MKFLIVIVASCLIGTTYGGVSILGPQEENEALELFARLCSGGGDGGELGGARIWCKFAPGEQVELVNHNVDVPLQPLPDTIVFVQPPPVSFKHNVAVQGGTGVQPRTKIYVLPQKSSHAITSQYNPGSVVTSKPTVYFLKSGGSNEGGYRYGTPAPPGVAGYAK